METTLQFLKQQHAERFFGAITLKFEAGRVVHIKVEKTLKPDDLSDKPRDDDAHRN